MQIDELRRELTSLADEIEPFTGDAPELHRRARRRRVATASLAVALVAVVALGALAARHGRDPQKIRITGIPSKQVPAARITHIDAIVVPATPDVQAALDASPLVARYARIPAGARHNNGSSLLVPAGADPALCGLQTRDGFAVDAVPADTNVQAPLAGLLAGRGAVYDTSDPWGADFEMFFHVGVAPEYADAVLSNLHADPDVQSVHVVSQQDTYGIFKKDFADQPTLVRSTKPSDLPESVRVVLRPGRSVATVIARYTHADGIDTVITFQSAIARLFDPSEIVPGPAKAVPPCTSP